MEQTVCRTLLYNGEKLTEQQPDNFSSLLDNPENLVAWVSLSGLGDVPFIEKLGRELGIHRLIVEDILNVRQMVKLDNYDDCVFLVFKNLSYDTDGGIITEHAGIVLRGNVVLSFQEGKGNLFAGIREKLLSGRDNIRRLGADYLVYELLDTAVDSYFHVIDRLGDASDDIEEQLISHPDRETLQNIYRVKRRLMFMRKSVYPLRGMVGELAACLNPMLGDGMRIYYRDVYDHLIQISDSIETYQDILSNMLDTYLSSVSNRTNDTMKILTIFSTIFIPLTFIAGVYGMNFKDIPELRFGYAYPVFWVVCVIIAALMLLFFHRKKWF